MNKMLSKLFKRAMITYTHLKCIFKRLGKVSKKVEWAQPIKTSKYISEMGSGKSYVGIEMISNAFHQQGFT